MRATSKAEKQKNAGVPHALGQATSEGFEQSQKEGGAMLLRTEGSQSGRMDVTGAQPCQQSLVTAAGHPQH